MTVYYDEVLAEVHENKAKSVEMYGGYYGLLKHLDEQSPKLEKEGWTFLDINEVSRKNMQRQLREKM